MNIIRFIDFLTSFYNYELTPFIIASNLQSWKLIKGKIILNNIRIYYENNMVWFEGEFGKTEQYNKVLNNEFAFMYNIEYPIRRIRMFKVGDSYFYFNKVLMMDIQLQYADTSLLIDINDKLKRMTELLVSMTYVSFLYHLRYMEEKEKLQTLRKTSKEFIISMLLDRNNYINDKDIITDINENILNMEKMDLDTIIDNYF